MKMAIRLAVQEDFEGVGRVFAEENQFHADLVPEIIQVADPIMTGDWYAEVLNNPSKNLLVAQTGSKIVGVVMFETRSNIDDDIFTPRKYVHINDIAVLESHQGQSIGRLLLESVHGWAKDQGISEIELQVWERNTAAIGFYEKLGYQNWRRTLRFRLNDETE